MIIELVRKEFIKKRSSDSSSALIRSLKIIFSILLIGCFIALEVMTFLSLDKKIIQYSKYGSFDFLILYLFVVMLICLIASSLKARKLLFNVDDTKLVSPLPISKEEIVFSKWICVYLNAVALMLTLSTPILIAYGINKVNYAWFYIFTFLYPFLISLFISGFALILSPLFEMFYRFIKVSDLLQFVLASILVILLCFAYKFVLELFLLALSDSSIGGIFSLEFVNRLHNASKFFAPVYNVIALAIHNTDISVITNIVVFVGLILIIDSVGFFLASYFYSFFINKSLNVELKKKSDKKMKIVSPSVALMKKEFVMLFKNHTYIFSYTSLLIMAPFLSFVVISSLNAIIYQNLRFFDIYYPELINGINLTLVLLFLSVINSSAALSMSREERMIQIVKYLPISPLRQIMIKLITPMCLSIISLLVTLVTLLATKSITPVVFGVSLLLGVILLFADNVLSMEWDMHDKSDSKHKLASLNVVLSLGFPLVILFVHFLMSFLNSPGYLIYIVEMILGLLLLLPCFIKIKSRYINAFNRMEIH